jgi:hypothetical protein
LTAPAFTSKERKGTLQGNRALDACHGEISNVPWDGKMTRIYDYAATLEIPIHGWVLSRRADHGQPESLIGGGRSRRARWPGCRSATRSTAACEIWSSSSTELLVDGRLGDQTLEQLDELSALARR